MRDEQATLGSFGGGTDPSPGNAGDEEEVRMRTQLVVTGGDRTITDLGVRLERDLVERLDPQLLQTGEERHRLHLSPQQADWADAMYIRAASTDESRKFDRVVMQYDGYPTVGLPRAWLRNSVVNGIDNPFSEVNSDDYVVVRYLSEDAIEIYPEWVYKAHPDFTWIRGAVPIVTVSGSGSEQIDCVDLAASTPYEGRMFEIMPFDWDVFSVDYISCFGRDDLRTRDIPLVTADDFTHVLKKRGIKPCSLSSILIKWRTGPEPPEALLSEKGQLARFRVVLPVYGQFTIGSLSPELNRTTRIFHQSFEHAILDVKHNDSLSGPTPIFNSNSTVPIDDEWFGDYFEIPEHGPPILYVPAAPNSIFPVLGEPRQ